MRIIASLFLCSLLSSCALLYLVEIDIGKNDFADLAKDQMARVKPFENLDIDNAFKYDNKLYEVDSADIQKIIKSNNLVWVHTWRPFCSAEECQFIAPFQAKAEKNSIKLYMISETYDFNSLDTITKRANFKYPLFVVSDQYYGSNINKSSKEFDKDILNVKKTARNEFYSDYLFKDGKLIYKGLRLLSNIDSIIDNTQ